MSKNKKIGSFFKELDDTIGLRYFMLDLLKEQKKFSKRLKIWFPKKLSQSLALILKKWTIFIQSVK